HISDGTATIFCGILSLILPESNSFNRKHDWKYESIAKGTPLAQRTSWDSILLLGAGLTIATAFEVTSSGIHPAFLIFPCTLAVSLAFMLPIATPPSAIVFASGAIRVIDMVATGRVHKKAHFHNCSNTYISLSSQETFVIIKFESQLMVNRLRMLQSVRNIVH
ncbi:unnamed protein product, partial [Rotaria magnacalcarata]